MSVVVNEDEHEREMWMSKVPQLNDRTEFPPEALQLGMQEGIQSMIKFGVFKEVDSSRMTREQQQSAITSRWVPKWKGDKVKSR